MPIDHAASHSQGESQELQHKTPSGQLSTFGQPLVRDGSHGHAGPGIVRNCVRSAEVQQVSDKCLPALKVESIFAVGQRVRAGLRATLIGVPFRNREHDSCSCLAQMCGVSAQLCTASAR